MPTKTWVVGEEVLAADFNSFVQKQVVATFANAAARDAAIPAPAAGMVVWLADLAAIQVRVGTAWRTLGNGLLGISELTINSGGVGPTPAASTLIVDAVVPASGHRIRASAHLVMQQQSGGPSQIHADIYMNGATTGQATLMVPGPGFITLAPMRILSPAAGTHRFQVNVWTDAGTAIIAGALSTATLTVEDLGVWP